MDAYSHLASELLKYSYWFLFPAVLLEGPIITFVAGWLVALGHLNFWLSYGLVVCANVIGDVALYSLGRAGRGALVPRLRKWLNFSAKQLKRFEKHYTAHPKRVIVFGKFSHSVGGPILIAAGMVELPLRRFLSISICTTFIQSIILLGIGYYYGDSTLPLEAYMRYLALASLIVFIMAGYTYGRRLLFDKAG